MLVRLEIRIGSSAISSFVFTSLAKRCRSGVSLWPQQRDLPCSDLGSVRTERQADLFLLRVGMWQKMSVFGLVCSGCFILYPGLLVQNQPLKCLTHTSTHPLVATEAQVVLVMSLHIFMIS